MQTIAKFLILAVIFLSACAGEEKPSLIPGHNKSAITTTVSCDKTTKECSIFLRLAASGLASGTTVTTIVDGTGSTSFHQAYSSDGAELADGIYQLPTKFPYGTFQFVGTRLYPPPTTFSARSLVQVQRAPVDFIINSPDIKVVVIDVYNLDSDGDGLHDYIDPTPFGNCTSNCGPAPTGTVNGTINSNDTDGDGCANSLDPQPSNPAVGCPINPVTNPTTTSTITWYPQLWVEWFKNATPRAAKIVTDSTYGTMLEVTVVSGLTASYMQQLQLIDGPITLGENRQISGEMYCNTSGVVYATVINANPNWELVSGYYAISVTANTLVKFSQSYVAALSVTAKQVSFEVGALPVGAVCRFRYLREQ